MEGAPLLVIARFLRGFPWEQRGFVSPAVRENRRLSATAWPFQTNDMPTFRTTSKWLHRLALFLPTTRTHAQLHCPCRNRHLRCDAIASRRKPRLRRADGSFNRARWLADETRKESDRHHQSGLHATR